MNKVDLWMASRPSRCRVDMMAAKIATNFESIGDIQICKVLVAEC